jgi:hypothetical protein
LQAAEGSIFEQAEGPSRACFGTSQKKFEEEIPKDLDAANLLLQRLLVARIAFDNGSPVGPIPNTLLFSVKPRADMQPQSMSLRTRELDLMHHNTRLASFPRGIFVEKKCWIGASIEVTLTANVAVVFARLWRIFEENFSLRRLPLAHKKDKPENRVVTLKE